MEELKTLNRKKLEAFAAHIMTLDEKTTKHIKEVIMQLQISQDEQNEILMKIQNTQHGVAEERRKLDEEFKQIVIKMGMHDVIYGKKFDEFDFAQVNLGLDCKVCRPGKLCPLHEYKSKNK